MFRQLQRQPQQALVPRHQGSQFALRAGVERQILQLVQAPAVAGVALSRHGQPFVTRRKACAFGGPAPQHHLDLNARRFGDAQAQSLRRLRGILVDTDAVSL